MKSFPNPFRLLALMLFAAHPVHAAVIASTWTDASANGLWSTSTNWSPNGVPNNGANTYNVTINTNSLASGATLSSATTVSSLLLSGSVVALTANANLTVSGTATVLGELDVNAGTTSLGLLTNFSGTTLTDGTFSVGSATLKFAGANIVTNAASINLTSSNAQVLNQTNSANALANFAVNDAGGAFAVSDRTFATPGAFTNNGVLEVGSSTLIGRLIITGTLTNFAAGTLTGGEYYATGYTAGRSAMLQFPSATQVVTNAASIGLFGPFTQILSGNSTNALASFAVNAVDGYFEIDDRNFTTGGSFSNSGFIDIEPYGNASTFTVAGTLLNTGTFNANASGANGSIVVTGSLTNFSGTTLTGGEYDLTAAAGLTCTLKFPGANIVTNAATLALSGTGAQILSGSNTNALANLAANSAAGEFDIEDLNFTTAGGFTNSGVLGVSAAGANSIFTITGSLANFSGTTLTGGEYDVSAVAGQTATLKFPGANIVTNAADIYLSGSGSRIVNQSNADALANLSTIATSGTFTIDDRTFAASGSLTNNGSVDMEAGATLLVPVAYTQLSGTTTLDGSTGATLSASGPVSIQGGMLNGGGHIVGNVTFGSPASVALVLGGTAQNTGYDSLNVAGAVALNGKLLVTFTNSFQSAISGTNAFTVLAASGGLGGSFSNAVNGGRIPTADGFGSFLVTTTTNNIVLSDYWPSSSFAAWRNSNFSGLELGDATISGVSADPDHDGLVNLAEYAMSLIPHSADSAGAVVQSTAAISGTSYLAITYTRSKAASDATCIVEVSNDLANWQSGPQFTSFVNRVDQVGTERITWHDNAPISASARRFIRLRFTQP